MSGFDESLRLQKFNPYRRNSVLKNEITNIKVKQHVAATSRWWRTKGLAKDLMLQYSQYEYRPMGIQATPSFWQCTARRSRRMTSVLDGELTIDDEVAATS